MTKGPALDIDAWIDRLIEHEITYFRMAARCERTENAAYLYAPDLPEYHDANRAIRLRTAGRSAEAVAAEVVAYYGARGLPPVADIDPIAEEQGIGHALRRLAITPVAGDRLLMRYASPKPPLRLDMGVTVHVVPNESGRGEAVDWIETAVADDVGWPDETLWRAVAEREARYSACRLYLASVDAQPAGVCDLFEYAKWGRVESVVTRPELRRRGVGNALVARAVTDSLTSGNDETYLFTEPGGAAERLYRRLGFAPWQMNVLRQHRG